MIFIDYKDRRPVYEQIADRYQELVIHGVLTEDTPLPSVRVLAMELSINPNTIQRAYAEMERRGISYSVKGRGSFICGGIALIEKKKRELLAELSSLLQEAVNLGIDESTLTTLLKQNNKRSKSSNMQQNDCSTKNAEMEEIHD